MSEPARQLDIDQSPQVVGDAIGLDEPKARGCVEVGERFGELVALKIHAADRRGHIWLCECDCGRLALRHAVDLRRSVREGHCPMCAQCLRELRRGLRVAKNETAARRRSFIARAFVETGSLYANGWEAAEIIELRRELGLRDPPPPEPVRDTETLGSDTGPAPRYAMSLSEIAREFDCTRECIRQIEARALRKLRHPSRLHILAEFVDGRADQVERARREKRLLSIRRAELRIEAQEKVRRAREEAVAILQSAGKWREEPEAKVFRRLRRQYGKNIPSRAFRAAVNEANTKRLCQVIADSRATEHARAVDEALARIESVESRLSSLLMRGRAPKESEVDNLSLEGRSELHKLRVSVEGWPEDGLGRKK